MKLWGSGYDIGEYLCPTTLKTWTAKKMTIKTLGTSRMSLIDWLFGKPKEPDWDCVALTTIHFKRWTLTGPLYGAMRDYARELRS